MPLITHETKRVELLGTNDESYQLEYDCIYESFMYGEDADGNKGEQRNELVDYGLIAAYFNGKQVELSEVPKEIRVQGNKEVEG